MSNKSKEKAWGFFPLPSMPGYKFMNSIFAENSLVFTFKAVLSVNSMEPARQSLRHLLRISQASQ